MTNTSLLSTTSRIEAPFIKISIGAYTFGVYQKVAANEIDEQGFYQAVKIVYPNYVQSLKVTKINGQVNQYVLVLKYPVTQNDDPNFFEKVFSSVSKTRKIVFSYGDVSQPSYTYKDEQAIITRIQTSFGAGDSFNSVIQYTVYATSSASLGMSGNYDFIYPGLHKPSDLIKKILYNPYYGLQELFYGMNSEETVEQAGLIPGDDKEVVIGSKTNISAMEEISYLTSLMVPSSSVVSNTSKDLYILTIHDDANYDSDLVIPQNSKIDSTVTKKFFGGPYFKIVRNTQGIQTGEAYELDIGYPTNNLILNFSIDNQENYSIYYEWNKSLKQEEYVRRLDDQGQWEDVYSPTISSKNDLHATRVEDQTWWSKITEYPITASVTLKGLLRPAVLMSHVRLRMWFPGGRKHISSGLYIVTSQVDEISSAGYKTTLGLTRIAADEEL